MANASKEILSSHWHSDLLSRLPFSYAIRQVLYASEILFLGIDFRELKTYPHKMCLGTYSLNKKNVMFTFVSSHPG